MTPPRGALNAPALKKAAEQLALRIARMGRVESQTGADFRKRDWRTPRIFGSCP